METKKKATRLYKSKVLEDFFTIKDTKAYKKTEKNMLLALRIEKAMHAKEWNRVRFAKEMGTNPPVVTKWLGGTHNFTTDTLFEIEAVLGICLVNTSDVLIPETVRWCAIQVQGSSPATLSPFSMQGLTSVFNLSTSTSANGKN